MAIDVRVEELRLGGAEAIARDPAPLEKFETDVVADAKSALRALAVRTALAAVLGALAAALVSSLALRSLIVGVVVGSVLVAGVLGATLGTWRAEAVAEPRYTGLLTTAPKAVGDLEAVIERFGQYRAQLVDLVQSLITLYGVGANLPSFDPSRATTLIVTELQHDWRWPVTWRCDPAPSDPRSTGDP